MGKFIEEFRRRSPDILPLLKMQLSKVELAAAEEAADKFVVGTERLLAECATVQELKALLERRYSGMLEKLQALAQKPASIGRFCSVCKCMAEGIELSLCKDDCSFIFSGCGKAGFSILIQRPKAEDNLYFGMSEQLKVAKAFGALLQKMREYWLRFGSEKFSSLQGVCLPAWVALVEHGKDMTERIRRLLFGEVDGKCFFKKDSILTFQRMFDNTPNLEAIPPGAPLCELWSRDFQLFEHMMVCLCRENVLVDQASFKHGFLAKLSELDAKMKQRTVIKQNASKYRRKLIELKCLERNLLERIEAEGDKDTREALNEKLIQCRAEFAEAVAELKEAGLTPQDVGYETETAQAAAVNAQESKGEAEKRKRKGGRGPAGHSKFAGQALNPPRDGGECGLRVDSGGNKIVAWIDRAKKEARINAQQVINVFDRAFERCRENFKAIEVTWIVAIENDSERRQLAQSELVKKNIVLLFRKIDGKRFLESFSKRRSADEPSSRGKRRNLEAMLKIACRGRMAMINPRIFRNEHLKECRCSLEVLDDCLKEYCD